MKYLLFDMSNVLYRTFFANKEHDIDTSTGIAHHTALMSMNKFFKEHNPDKAVMVFDRPSWRKEYTQSPECISRKKYKGNRRVNMTPKEREKFDRFLDHVREFEDIMREHTSIICLSEDGLEADDLIAGFVEAYGEDGVDEIVIISRDRDLAQMLGMGKDILFNNVTQWDPTTGNQITIESAIKDLLKERENSIVPSNLFTVDFFLYAKCLRGDTSDNVQSAYPGIRKTRIVKAYQDPYERINLLQESWDEPQGASHVVKDLFNEGKMLMDLRQQPEKIRAKIFSTILNGTENTGKFKYFEFMRILGKYKMKRIADDLKKFTPLLNC